MVQFGVSKSIKVLTISVVAFVLTIASALVCGFVLGDSKDDVDTALETNKSNEDLVTKTAEVHTPTWFNKNSQEDIHIIKNDCDYDVNFNF